MEKGKDLYPELSSLEVTTCLSMKCIRTDEVLRRCIWLYYIIRVVLGFH